MRNAFLSICIWTLFAAGSFLAVCGALDYWESRHAQDQIASEWRQSEDAQAPAALPSPSKNSAPREVKKQIPHVGETLAKLIIPRLDTTLYVVEGTDERDLKRGPGHVTVTVLPGEDGNCVIAGHRDTHFRVLRNIRDGDEVILERRGRQFRYKVREMMLVTPDNTASLRPTSKPVLNLITCYPFQYVGSAPERFVVHADLEDSSLVAHR